MPQNAIETAGGPAAAVRAPVELRWYQREAVRAVYRHLREKRSNPCVCLPTGSGKSYILAQICTDAVKRWGGRALVLAHRKELLEQNADKIQQLCPDLEVGVYSAGLGSRDGTTAVVVAGIQSVWQRAQDLGPFQLILVDEAHLLVPEGEGMYRTFVQRSRELNPKVFFVGLTATPYRLQTGMLCGAGELLNEICYEISPRELIAKGFLSPLISREGTDLADTSGVAIRAGEFAHDELETLMSDSELVDSAAREIVELTRERSKCLLFASGLKHARALKAKLEELGETCGFISGETRPGERARVLKEFREGGLKYLSNCDILTTGFDAPNIDCIALLRPTQSPGLYYQMVGRGLRCHPGKKDCLVLDYGGNIRRHGPVDKIRIDGPGGTGERGAGAGHDGDDESDGQPALKTCPKCRALVEAAYSVCVHCGYTWPMARHSARASYLEPLSSDIGWHDVSRVAYSVHRRRGAPPGHPQTLRVDYHYGEGLCVSDFVCVEHAQYPRYLAEVWWRARTQLICPRTAEEALAVAERGGLLEPKRLLIRALPGEYYPRIAEYDMHDQCPPEQRERRDDAERFQTISWDDHIVAHGKEPF